jgi:hypothetical protein
MALIPSVLAAGLKNLNPTMQEMEAINTIASAYNDFISGAMAGPIPIIPGALNGAKAAMIGSLSGLSNDGNAANTISNAVTAYWGVMSGAGAALFPTATSITPPPTLSLIGTLLGPIFTANTSGKLSLSDCADNVANVIAANSQGGIAIFPPPPTGLGPQPIS